MLLFNFLFFFFFSSRRRHTRSLRDWSSDVCSSDLATRSPYRSRRTKSLKSVSVSPDSNQHRSEEHTSELQLRRDLVCRLLLEKKNPSLNLVYLFAFCLAICLNGVASYPNFLARITD